MTITPAAAITDPALLGPYFAGNSWARWRAILKAAYGEPLSGSELSLFSDVAGGRAPPRRRVKELVVIAGRRSGKDSVASAIAAIAATEDFSLFLRPGERATVMCLAVDREQAKIVHRYIAGYFHQIPLLRPLLGRETDDGLELVNGIEIVVATNSYRSVRGRTIACAIFDEAAFWRSEDSANPDTETYTAVRPGLVTLPDSILVIITTAYRKSGLAFNKFSASFGKNDDNCLVVYGPSTAFNPSLPQEIIDDALRDDPEAASAEWLSIWRSDISDFLDRELVDAAIDRGVAVRPPRPGLQYHAFADPSGGRGDSFTLAISHAEGSSLIVDLVYERRAPFDPGPVVREIADTLRQYSIYEVTGDRYAANWTVEGFAREGVRYVQSDRNRSEIYLDALPIFTAGRARLPENHRAEHQLVSLERRTSRSGKDIVNHPPGGADDLANSLCGSLTLAASAAAPALWRAADLKTNGAAIPWPARCLRLYATAGVDGHGVFICIWADGVGRYLVPYNSGLPRTVLIDFDQSPLTPSLFRDLAERMAALATEVNRPGFDIRHDGLLCAPELIQHGAAAGFSAANGDAMLAPGLRETLLLTAATEIGTGAVKVATPAEVTSRRLPLPLGEIAANAPRTAAGDAALLGIVGTMPADMWPRDLRGWSPWQ